MDYRDLIISFLDALVHKRLTKKELEQQLSYLLNKSIVLTEETNECDTDYRYSFGADITDNGVVWQSTFDIWFLTTRTNQIYITEVAYMFE